MPLSNVCFQWKRTKSLCAKNGSKCHKALSRLRDSPLRGVAVRGRLS